jgi:hypothetical protein
MERASEMEEQSAAAEKGNIGYKIILFSHIVVGKRWLPVLDASGLERELHKFSFF